MSKSAKSEEAPDQSVNRSQVVRLSANQSERVAILSERFGVTQAQVLRWALDALFLRVDACGGRIILPLVFNPQDEAGVSPLSPAVKAELADD